MRRGGGWIKGCSECPNSLGVPFFYVLPLETVLFQCSRSCCLSITSGTVHVTSNLGASADLLYRKSADSHSAKCRHP